MTQGRLVHPWVAEGAERVRFGVVGNFVKGWPEHLRFATEAERLGYDSCALFDHPNRLMECWTLMSALAASTERIRLISMVSCIYYRSAFMLARQAADVDRISGGRLVLGVGIGDDVPEFAELGLPFGRAGVRQAAMAETVRVVQALWHGERVTSEVAGGHLDGAGLRPGPVQEPHVPVLIGGGGEKTTLRQVAELADVSNFAPHEWAGSAFDVTDVARKYGVLRDYCAAAGRPFGSVLRSHFTPLLVLAEDEQQLARKQAAQRIPDPHLTVRHVFATPADAIGHYQGLADAGVQYFIAGIDSSDEETMRLLAQAVWPAIKVGAQLALAGSAQRTTIRFPAVGSGRDSASATTASRSALDS
jgi:alkanesulfonate monooxygenase SsuD/methylene tetrahydromethanopterin reductase-like flavin-dependent oxidoreductase (luciferase family)